MKFDFSRQILDNLSDPGKTGKFLPGSLKLKKFLNFFNHVIITNKVLKLRLIKNRMPRCTSRNHETHILKISVLSHPWPVQRIRKIPPKKQGID